MDIVKITQDLKEKYPDVGIKSIEVDESTGKATFYVEPTRKALAILEQGGVKPRVYRDYGSVISRDYVQRTNLDLASKKDAYSLDPKEAFKKAIQYYYNDPLVGPATNVMASLACKGFENDADDEEIKRFYDQWAFDVRFEEVLEWIYLDFFKVGHVVTYKVLSKYEPSISYIAPGKSGKSGKSGNKTTSKPESGAKKKIWSSGHMPTSYTVLNPLLVNISGNLLFDKVYVTLTPPKELADLLKKDAKDLSVDEKDLIAVLPADLKKAIKDSKEFVLDSRQIGQVTYRKQPYERYARPRTGRIFDNLEYKKSLREADLSTLDGITNYILKITIGNDEYPVTTQTELETISKLFDSPSKSFDVVWNHTLNVEKIVSPEIDKILGKGKYEQVNDDMTLGLGISRAIIDGSGGMNGPDVELFVKGLMTEINYARQQVTRWIYREYQQIAEASGFESFPKVRWDDGILLDPILYMNTLAQLVDRRMLSYKTSLEALGFDYSNELEQMGSEVTLVEDGTFGILGSPWQKAKESVEVQPNQNAPTGTPSGGRPKGTSKPKEKNVDPNKQPGQKPGQKNEGLKNKNQASLAEMSTEELAAFLCGAREVLSCEELSAFLGEVGVASKPE